MYDWIEKLYQDKDMLRMGHCQSLEDLNLGMGWLYYALARLIKTQTIVIIGSWRGFSPIIFAKALSDNAGGGVVHFIDPSLADDFWKDANKVNGHFKSYDADNIQHYLMTTQEFVESDTYNTLNEVGIVFIDGLHTKEQAKFDYDAFNDKISANGIFLFHDSIRMMWNKKIYKPDIQYQKDVKIFMDELKTNTTLQVLDLPFASGLTLVRNI